MVREKGLSTKTLKKLSANSNDMRKLDSKTCDGFDFSFSFKLLPLICDDIKGYDPNTSAEENENKLECLLEKLRIIRNGVVHEPTREAISPDIKDGVVKISLKMLDVAGAKYSVPGEVIEKAKKKFLSLIRDALAILYSEAEITDWEIRLFLSHEDSTTFSEKKSSSNYVAPLQLTLGNTILSSSLLLQHIATETHNFILIEGNNGTGKSSLLADTYRKVLSSKTVLRSNAFEVPILLKCNETLSETLADYVEEYLMETYPIQGSYLKSMRSQSGEDIVRVLKQMRLLFLIDGFDEASKSCLVLLKEVVKFVKQNELAKCLVSSRHYSSAEQESFFSMFRVQPQILQIATLSTRNDQINFLKESCKDGGKASETYERLGLSLKKPSHLALFVRLYAENAEEVKSWSSGVQMMKHVINEDKKRVSQRLKMKMVRNAIVVANKILKEVKAVSFFCLLQNFGRINREFLEAFDQNIDDKFSDVCGSFQVIEILSGFFTIETSDEISEPSLSYKFYNSSHLEALAGMHFIQELDGGKKSIKEVIESSNERYGRFRAKSENHFSKDTSQIKM